MAAEVLKFLNKSFNSLSRDHILLIYAAMRLVDQDFQLPLSGSLETVKYKNLPAHYSIDAFNSLSRDHLI